MAILRTVEITVLLKRNTIMFEKMSSKGTFW
jgi:hypothetical protein